MKLVRLNNTKIHNLRLILRKFTNCLHNEDYLNLRLYEYAFPRQVFAFALSELNIPITQIAKVIGKHYSTVYNSISAGWDLTTQYSTKKTWLPVYNQFYNDIRMELDDEKK